MAKQKKRRKFTPDQKVAILKEDLIDKIPEVCDKHDIGISTSIATFMPVSPFGIEE